MAGPNAVMARAALVGPARVGLVGPQQRVGRAAAGGDEPAVGQAGQADAGVVERLGVGRVGRGHPAFGQHAGKRLPGVVGAGLRHHRRDRPQQVELAPQPVRPSVPPRQRGGD